MPFTSTILQSSTTTKVYSINEDKPTVDSYLDTILQLNESMHRIETDYNRNYYRYLVEDAMGYNTDIAIQEGLLGDIKEKIIKIIDTIIEYIKKFFKTIFGRNTEAEFKKFDSKQKENDSNDHTTNNSGPSRSTGSANSNTSRSSSGSNDASYDLNKEYEFNIYKFPNFHRNGVSFVPVFVRMGDFVNDALGGKMEADSLQDSINNYIDKQLWPVVQRCAERSRKTFSEKVKDSESYKNYVLQDVIYTETKRMKPAEFKKIIDDFRAEYRGFQDREFAQISGNIISTLEEWKRKVKASQLDEGYARCLNTLFSKINVVVQISTWFQNTLQNAFFKAMRYYDAEGDKIFRSYRSGYRESATIHGEPFDSDTLFDNADFRDFNPTEWLNLELTTECYQIEYEMMESYRRTALQEALIFTDDEPLKFSRIKAMQEAEGGKLKDAITTIINRIREFIEQFFAKIKDKFGANSRYISSNKETISKPINSSMECKSKGDILAGLYRVQERTALKPFNYETMKEDLKDKNTFFKNHVLSTLSGTSPNSKRQVKYEDGMAITEYCKAYFGAPMPEDKYPLCTFTAKDLESNKENMVKFVQDSAKFLASIKTDLRNLEAEAKKNAVNEPIKNDGTADKKTNSDETQSSTTPALGSGETKQESTLYSYLYNSWFTEAEINVDEEKAKESGEGSGANDRATAFKNYVECYKDVILSKLTAAEFISSEFMQIIEKHVEMNGGSKQKTQKDNDQK